MRTERLTSCFELLQKLRARLESRLTGLSSNLSTAVLLIWFTVLLVLVSFFVLFSPSMYFYDIGSDCMVTLWERAAHSVYNMFSVPSGKHVRVIYIPLHPLLYSKSVVYRGIHYFLIFAH